MNQNERTFVMVKPDGLQRGLAGDIIHRLERKGLKLVGLKLMRITHELAAKHYGEHQGKPFFESLLSFITSAPVVAMVWEGEEAVSQARNIIGATDPRKAAPGTIRGDLALFAGNNLVHGSDSPESAGREISLFFHKDEICDYRASRDEWVYGQ